MITEEIKKLSKEERMILMEEIWDTLCHEEEIESPSWLKMFLINGVKK